MSPTQIPELDGVRHEYLDAAGLRVHVALAGPEDGPAVMLLHGWPQNWWAWRKVIPVLATRFRVIVPDLRGHGWSEAPPGGYEKEQLASDTLAVLDQLSVDRVTWIGHDWGGFTGLLAGLRAPERIDRMLALCIPHPWSKPDPRRVALMLGYQGPISLPGLGGPIAARVVPAILQSGRQRDRLSPEDLAVFTENLPPYVSVGMYRTFLTREMLPIARGRYANDVLQVPTTLAIGDRDLVTKGTPPGPVAGQPQLHVEVLPDVAHWAPEQQPQVVIDFCEEGASGS